MKFTLKIPSVPESVPWNFAIFYQIFKKIDQLLLNFKSRSKTALVYLKLPFKVHLGKLDFFHCTLKIILLEKQKNESWNLINSRISF